MPAVPRMFNRPSDVVVEAVSPKLLVERIYACGGWADVETATANADAFGLVALVGADFLVVVPLTDVATMHAGSSRPVFTPAFSNGSVGSISTEAGRSCSVSSTGGISVSTVVAARGACASDSASSDVPRDTKFYETCHGDFIDPTPDSLAFHIVPSRQPGLQCKPGCSCRWARYSPGGQTFAIRPFRAFCEARRSPHGAFPRALCEAFGFLPQALAVPKSHRSAPVLRRPCVVPA